MGGVGRGLGCLCLGVAALGPLRAGEGWDSAFKVTAGQSSLRSEDAARGGFLGLSLEGEHGLLDRQGLVVEAGWRRYGHRGAESVPIPDTRPPAAATYHGLSTEISGKALHGGLLWRWHAPGTLGLYAQAGLRAGTAETTLDTYTRTLVTDASGKPTSDKTTSTQAVRTTSTTTWVLGAGCRFDDKVSLDLGLGRASLPRAGGGNAVGLAVELALGVHL